MKKSLLIWEKFNTQLLLALLILVFSGYAVYVATHLQRDIVPDEPYHFAVSKSFAPTWGIPEDVFEARSMGVSTRQNPFFAYWLNGRALNLLNWVKPNSSDWQQLVFLRLVNVVYSIGTVIFAYLFSKELIQHKWWSLLPVFILTNTLMFVLLSGGVSYDNLTNLLSIAGLYYLLRVLKGKDFVINSLLWLILIALGALTKETILPLALGMTVAWVIFVIKNRSNLDLTVLKTSRAIVLLFVMALLVVGNLAIYGLNLIRYQSLTPACSDVYTLEFCQSTAQAIRRQQLALPEKLTVLQAFRQGYPEPIRYAFDTWIRAMLMKTFGIMGGQKSYYPIGITYFHILLYWMIALGIRYYQKTSYKIYALAGIFCFYALTLFIKNYSIELAYGFIQVALQGRYIFPVIGIAYGLGSFGLMKVPKKLIRSITLLVIIILFLYGGPIRFIIYNQSVFADWFV